MPSAALSHHVAMLSASSDVPGTASLRQFAGHSTYPDVLVTASSHLTAVAAAALVALVAGTAIGAVRRRWLRHRLRPSEGASGARLRWPRIRWRRRARPPGPAAVAGWCDAVARQVRSGATLRMAVEAVPTDRDVAAATQPLRQHLRRGLPLAAAAQRFRDELDGGRSGPLVAATAIIAVLADLGGAAAPSLDRVAAALRQEAADAAERGVQSAQARLSAAVMTLVPAGVLVLLAAADPGVRAAASTPIGMASIAAGSALGAAGWWWMRRIIAAPGAGR